MSLISIKQSEEYVARGGGKCPLCESINIEAEGSAEFSGPNVYQDVRCHDCGGTWIDAYNLVAAEDRED